MLTGNQTTRADINMTPMIDILLVLIIMFLVITPTKPVGLNAAVPQESHDSAPPTPSTVLIYAKGNGNLEVNQNPLSVDELPAKLMAIFHGRPGATVFVDGDKNLEFREIAQVIDLAKGAGIQNVGLMPGRP